MEFCKIKWKIKNMNKQNLCKCIVDKVSKYTELLNRSSNTDDLKDHIKRTENKIIYQDISFFDSLTLKNCCFEGKFYINSQYNNPSEAFKIDTLDIQDTKFHANFKLHNCEIKNFTLKDTDFEKNADFFKSKFSTNKDIIFHAINFRALALFGDTVFKEHLLFKYVTFQGYSHFRQAEFQKGLNLEYANKEDFCVNCLLFVLNKVILGYLYYQFVITIRKDTRK